MILNRKNNQGWKIGKTGLISLLFMTITSSPLHLLSRSSLATDVIEIEDSDTIRIDNLEDFQFRLQDTFNHDSLVSIYYENNRIESLVIIKQEQSDLSIPGGAAQSRSQPTKCHLPPNLCPHH